MDALCVHKNALLVSYQSIDVCPQSCGGKCSISGVYPEYCRKSEETFPAELSCRIFQQLRDGQYAMLAYKGDDLAWEGGKSHEVHHGEQLDKQCRDQFVAIFLLHGYHQITANMTIPVVRESPKCKIS